MLVYQRIIILISSHTIIWVIYTVIWSYLLFNIREITPTTLRKVLCSSLSFYFRAVRTQRYKLTWEQKITIQIAHKPKEIVC